MITCRDKLHHIIGSIFCSRLYIIVSLFLIIFTACCLNLFTSNNDFIAFLVGIVASTVSTLILKITDKYISSINAYETILLQVQTISKYIKDQLVENNDAISVQKFKVNEMYTSACQLSNKLTYKKEFKKLSSAIYDLTYEINTQYRKDQIKEKLDTLRSVCESLSNINHDLIS